MRGVQEIWSNLLDVVRFSVLILVANSRSFHDGSLGLNSGCWGREFGGASLDGNALLLSTEATIGVGSNANGVLLGEALGVLGSSLSLSEVDSLEDGDGTLDGEGSVLGLDGEGGMSRLSAFAAVGLADLVELGVGDGVKLGHLAGFGVLLVALRDTGTEAWELSELAGALNIESGEVKVANADVAAGGDVGGEIDLSGDLSEVLHVLLTEGFLEALRGSSNDTSEEGDEEEFHLDVLMML
jgi:hypothetical protein